MYYGTDFLKNVMQHVNKLAPAANVDGKDTI